MHHACEQRPRRCRVRAVLRGWTAAARRNLDLRHGSGAQTPSVLPPASGQGAGRQVPCEASWASSNAPGSTGPPARAVSRRFAPAPELSRGSASTCGGLAAALWSVHDNEAL